VSMPRGPSVIRHRSPFSFIRSTSASGALVIRVTPRSSVFPVPSARPGIAHHYTINLELSDERIVQGTVS
jgi:hypothetical protein